ncbi:hypothetical protein RND81_10G187700 [Saponaria officinalis]|uniref:MADS-box domain-containing protein n=1 Tax=Saponaria officinalis TaxID=3572 RepID=A0AAW1I413_SAPOF
MVKPISRGRQKIEMKKIKNKTHLGVTFTKRRNGIFKKANELVSLCGAELAIILYSPGNKPYSYGHPNVYAVLARFLGDFNVNKQKTKTKTVKCMEERYAQLKEIERLVEAEKRIARELRERVVRGSPIAMTPREKLTYRQMLEFRAMLKDLQLRISSVVQRRLVNGGDIAACVSQVKQQLES